MTGDQHTRPQRPLYEGLSAAELLAVADAVGVDVGELYELRVHPRNPRIHEAVRRLMEEHRWAQTTVAKGIGMKQPALHRRLSGQVEFSASELLDIARLMGLDVRQLYGLPVNEPAPA